MQFLFLLAVFRIEHLFMWDAVDGDLIRYYPEAVLLIVAETIALGFKVDPVCPVVVQAEVYALLKDEASLPLSARSRDYSAYVGKRFVFFVHEASEAGSALIFIHDEDVPASCVYAVKIKADAVLFHYKDF